MTGVWQAASEGRWCTAASDRRQQTSIDVWNFGTGCEQDKSESKGASEEACEDESEHADR
jgi:hypothetical protein